VSIIFLSDNSSGVHENVLRKISEVNHGFTFPYGKDKYTAEAEKLFSLLFGINVDVYFTVNGTSANVTGLSSVLSSFEGVLCADTTHINTDECGAFEKFTGAKIYTVENINGKINPEQLVKFLHFKGNEHHNQPKVVSISQCTETGTVYSRDEIKALADFAHDNRMFLHVDGARISNAVEAAGITIKEMFTDTGVDFVSFGGTKNGLMMGEAVIFLNTELSKNMKYIRKQSMQLVSKMRFISAQFLAYLENDLWLENARVANNAGKYFKKKLEEIPGISIIGTVDANIIFAVFPQHVIDQLLPLDYFYVMDPLERKVRFVTSFNTKNEDIDSFIIKLKEVL